MSPQQRDPINDEWRKVQSNGQVTLPKAWRDQYDPPMVSIEENEDGSLLIKPL